jgi:hypothetical protein
MKEAVFDFAKRRQLPQPRWWSDASEHATAGTKGGQGKPRQKGAPRNAGKQDRISIYLAENYPHGVPGPAIVPRKHLKNQLLAQDPTLKPLDEATLKSAIDRYNDRVSTQNDNPN